MHCSSADCTNYSITTVDQNSGSSCSIQISPNGLPIITYLDIVDYNIKVAQCMDVACLKANISTLVNGGVNEVSSVIGVDGNLLLAYTQNSTKSVMAAHCSDLRCSNATFSSLGWSSPTLPRVILSGDGFPLIFCNSTIGHCNDIYCSTISLVATPIANGIMLTTDTTGFPFAVITSSNLISLRCTTFDCSSFTTTTTLAQTVQYIALTMASDGLPLILSAIFEDDLSTPLMAIHCGNQLCTRWGN